MFACYMVRGYSSPAAKSGGQGAFDVIIHKIDASNQCVLPNGNMGDRSKATICA